MEEKNYLKNTQEEIYFQDRIESYESVRKTVPTVALRGMTVLPGMVIHFDLSRKSSILAVEQAMMGDQYLFLVPQMDPEEENPTFDNVYHIGCLAQIKQVTKLPESIVRVLVGGEERAELIRFMDTTAEYLTSEIDVLVSPAHLESAAKEEAMTRNIQELFTQYCNYYPRIGKTLLKNFDGIIHFSSLLDQVVENMPVVFEKKQDVLEAVDLEERYQVLAKLLYEEIEVAHIRLELSEDVKKRIEKNQRDYMLREQMNYIREELGENNTVTDAEQFTQALNKLKASKEVKEKIRKEIARFKNLGQGSAEASVERGYLETLLDLPWDKVSKDSTDINRAKEILKQDHYGLEQVKERILEFLAVRSLTKRGDSPIICLVGPPGTGKTSIARSVAESLNKRYVRICLGGVRDEAEIRGHRRTYVGAMPGRIVAGLKQAGVKNPLILLDEIDKVSSDYKGDTSSALLEVLDSEQNNHFRDHYLEIPVDLSEVLFIATANSSSDIPRPLLDRMEVIEVTSYTANEKFHIVKDHLLTKQLARNGLNEMRLRISDGALKNIIRYYTNEAGVRELERKIGEICRKAAKEFLEDQTKAIQVNSRNLERFLGKRKNLPDHINDQDEIGIVRGLAWTSVGGVTMQVEVNMMEGKGDFKLTGQMGDVMKESAMTALSYVRSVGSQYGSDAEVFAKHDFHIHMPEGAVPKDGPSAGITMATAILSVVTQRPVKADVAMTGEITLRGRVLPIGGLKEKMLAAKMAGITTIIVPVENERDVDEISREIKNGIKIIYARRMEDVLESAFVK